MRFSVALPVDRVDAPGRFQTAGAIAEIASAAERSGFDAVFVTDHPLPETDWLQAGGHHAMDPFVALSFAAAATTRIRLQTNLCVLPYRNPYITAKSVATLDALSGGRVILGVGGGYLRAELDALQAGFDTRNEQTAIAIREMKRAWTGEPFEVGGSQHVALPRPAQRPHPPIWSGGNSRVAIRRAVELCDGWAPFPNPPSAVSTLRTPALLDLDELRRRLDYARAHALKVGRSAPLDVMFGPIMRRCYGMEGFSTQELIDQIGAQSALGVTQMAVVFERTGRPHVPDRERYIELLAGFGEDVIRKVPL